MDKKRSSARLRKKGDYLPPEETEGTKAADQQIVVGSGIQPSTAPTQITSEPFETRTYTRARWKNIMRWLAFLFIVFLDTVVIVFGLRDLFHYGLGHHALWREGITFIMMFGFNLTVLPVIEPEH